MSNDPFNNSDLYHDNQVSVPGPMDPNVSAIEQILNEEHDLIMTESVTVDEGLAEMTRRVNALED